MLSFQRLDVHQRAIEFLALVYNVVDELPRGHACAASRKVITDAQYTRGGQLLEGVVAMLTKMV